MLHETRVGWRRDGALEHCGGCRLSGGRRPTSDRTWGGTPLTFASKADAEAWLAQERALVSGDGWVAPKRRAEMAERLAPPTFGEYAR